MALQHEEERASLTSSSANQQDETTDSEDVQQSKITPDTITLISKEFDSSVACEVRKMVLTINNEPKNIVHYLFARWPDFGKPDGNDKKALIELSRRSHQEAGDNPRVVHCSAGVGRTGTWIALDFLVREVEEDRLLDSVKPPESGDRQAEQTRIDSSKLETWGRSGPAKAMTPTAEEGFEKEEQDLIFDTVNTLREQRMMMVIREVQFSFLYEVVREAVLERYRAKPEGAVVKEGGDLDLRPRRSKQPRISDEYAGSESASEAETEIMDVDAQKSQNGNDDDDPYSAVSPDALRRGMSQEFGTDK